jgi:hypothetical protein
MVIGAELLGVAGMHIAEPTIPRTLGLRVGEWVEVRSEPEILSTLDGRGMLDNLPVMPQMLAHCGKRFRVRKRAHKLCDTATSTGGRKMANAVFLEELRCDGLAYGGCEMRCLIVWKEAWLKRAGGDSGGDAKGPDGMRMPVASVAHSCTRETIIAGTRAQSRDGAGADPTYVCQATEMPRATTPLSRWAIGQYVEDYRSGNDSLGNIVAGLLFIAYENIVNSGLGFGSAMRWFYDRFQLVRNGTPFPSRSGCLQKGARTPSATLGVKVGDVVRVKSHAEILKTVDEELRNRGMSFHPTMVPYCGKQFRVLQRAGKIMNERTGQLMQLKNECLVLEGADCVGRYTNPLSCPRSCYPYWREIWLERVEPTGATQEKSLVHEERRGA